MNNVMQNTIEYTPIIKSRKIPVELQACLMELYELDGGYEIITLKHDLEAIKELSTKGIPYAQALLQDLIRYEAIEIQVIV